jgi:hypothetical protein
MSVSSLCRRCTHFKPHNRCWKFRDAATKAYLPAMQCRADDALCGQDAVLFESSYEKCHGSSVTMGLIIGSLGLAGNIIAEAAFGGSFPGIAASACGSILLAYAAVEHDDWKHYQGRAKECTDVEQKLKEESDCYWRKEE